MSARLYILSIDLGTSGVKVALVGDDGSIAASALRPLKTLRLPGGGSEQDPEDIWIAITQAAGETIGRARPSVESVVGITCASQYFSIVPIDAAGLPVGNLILWSDTRGAPYAQRIHHQSPDAPALWLARNGMMPMPTGNDSLSHMMFLQAERPEIAERAHKFVEPADYITARLTGVSTSNACTAYAQLLTDNRRLDAVVYDDDLIASSGIDRSRLPDLIETGAPVGGLLADIAAEIGLAPNTPVFSGVNDTQAVTVGTRAFDGESGGINIGTTCQILAFVDSMKADIDNGILAMPSPLAGRYMVMAENGLGGRLVEHFLRNFVFASDALADHSRPDPFASIEAALASSTAGCNGLLYLPWLAGLQAPRSDPGMRGGFINMSLGSTRTDMLRAVVEGVTFNLRWQLPAVENFCGYPLRDLQFAGGGARSDQWAQIVADVMDRPVQQLAEAQQVNNRATAFLAFDRLGVVALQDASGLCPILRSYQPNPANRTRYDRLFEQFVAAYEQISPIAEALGARDGTEAPDGDRSAA